MLQVDGTGDTSSEEDEDEEEDYDDDEEEDKEKDGAEDGQVEEVSLSKRLEMRTCSVVLPSLGAKLMNSMFLEAVRVLYNVRF